MENGFREQVKTTWTATAALVVALVKTLVVFISLSTHIMLWKHHGWLHKWGWGRNQWMWIEDWRRTKGRLMTQQSIGWWTSLSDSSQMSSCDWIIFGLTYWLLAVLMHCFLEITSVFINVGAKRKQGKVRWSHLIRKMKWRILW